MTKYNIKLRHKACVSCSVMFCDITRRFTRTSCSASCSKAAAVAKRYANGTYVRTQAHINKCQTTMMARYGRLSHAWTDDERAKHSETMRQAYVASNVKEKIAITMLKRRGVRHWTQTPDGRKRCSEHFKRVAASEGFDVLRARAIDRWKKRSISQRDHRTSFGRGGRRADLGDQYFRSMWEANVARIMNALNMRWTYETETFVMLSGLTYTPDFIAMFNDGVMLYIEVKGYRDSDGMIKWNEFCDESRKCGRNVMLIDAERYATLRAMFKQIIGDTWEGK